MTDSIPQKWTCPKCGIEKPFTEKFFYKDPSLTHKLMHTCIVCFNEAGKRRNKGNPQAANKRARDWRAKNPEKVREITHRSEVKHNEERKARARQNNKNNPEQMRARKQRYNHTEKGMLKNRVYLRNRRALKITNGGKFTLDEILQLGEAQEWKCHYCRSDITDEYHIDHYIPLTKNGRNDIGNIVLACPFCNQSKHNKLPDAFIRQK